MWDLRQGHAIQLVEKMYQQQSEKIHHHDKETPQEHEGILQEHEGTLQEGEGILQEHEEMLDELVSLLHEIKVEEQQPPIEFGDDPVVVSEAEDYDAAPFEYYDW